MVSSNLEGWIRGCYAALRSDEDKASEIAGSVVRWWDEVAALVSGTVLETS